MTVCLMLLNALGGFCPASWALRRSGFQIQDSCFGEDLIQADEFAEVGVLVECCEVGVFAGV